MHEIQTSFGYVTLSSLGDYWELKLIFPSATYKITCDRPSVRSLAAEFLHLGDEKFESDEGGVSIITNVCSAVRAQMNTFKGEAVLSLTDLGSNLEISCSRRDFKDMGELLLKV